MRFESSTNRMIYKQDYKIVGTCTMNGDFFWMLYRKGMPVNANEEEMELVKSVLKINKLK